MTDAEFKQYRDRVVEELPTKKTSAIIATLTDPHELLKTLDPPSPHPGDWTPVGVVRPRVVEILTLYTEELDRRIPARGDEDADQIYRSIGAI